MIRNYESSTESGGEFRFRIFPMQLSLAVKIVIVVFRTTNSFSVNQLPRFALKKYEKDNDKSNI